MSEKATKKKGIFAAIRESMTKTGGCCGPGESCGCTPAEEKEETRKKTNDKSCCESSCDC